MGDRPIAFEEGTVVRQDKLPYPVVIYPNHYGTFFAFCEDEGEPFAFCSCTREAIETYVDFRIQLNTRISVNQNAEFILSSKNFPTPVVEELREIEATGHEILNHLDFIDGLCHECNDVVPKRRYCHDMYGTKFEQNYGWYIAKKGFELGINFVRIPSKSPVREIHPKYGSNDLHDLLDDDVIEQIEKYETLAKKRPEGTLSDDEVTEWEELRKSLSNQDKRLQKVAENEARRVFGHYEIGNRWTSETLLSQLVESEFPEYTIRRHYRPEFLDGLELDIFIEEAALGVEYQGVQHYEAVDYWGGEEALKKRQERDEKKRQLCRERGIALVEVRYDEELSEELIDEHIAPHVGNG